MYRKKNHRNARYSSNTRRYSPSQSQSLGRHRQFTAPSSKGMPNLDSTAPELALSPSSDRCYSPNQSLGRHRQFTAPSSKGMPNLDSTEPEHYSQNQSLGRHRQFTAPSSKGMPNLDSTEPEHYSQNQSLGRHRQFTAPSSKGMPNLDSTAPELALSPSSDRRYSQNQSLGRHRQFTAPSSKGMPNLDSTEPEHALSNNAVWDNQTNTYQELEDLSGLHNYITSSNRQRPFPACTTNDANHRSSPIFFTNPSSFSHRRGQSPAPKECTISSNASSSRHRRGQSPAPKECTVSTDASSFNRHRGQSPAPKECTVSTNASSFNRHRGQSPAPKECTVSTNASSFNRHRGQSPAPKECTISSNASSSRHRRGQSPAPKECTVSTNASSFNRPRGQSPAPKECTVSTNASSFSRRRGQSPAPKECTVSTNASSFNRHRGQSPAPKECTVSTNASSSRHRRGQSPAPKECTVSTNASSFSRRRGQSPAPKECTVSTNASSFNRHRGQSPAPKECTVSTNASSFNRHRGQSPAPKECTISSNASSSRHRRGQSPAPKECTVSTNASSFNRHRGQSPAPKECTISTNACTFNRRRGQSPAPKECTISTNACTFNRRRGQSPAPKECTISTNASSFNASASASASYGARTPRKIPRHPQHHSSKQPSPEFASATAPSRDSLSLRIPKHAGIPKLLHRVDGYNSSSDDSSDFEDGEIINSPRRRRKHDDGYHIEQINMSNDLGLHHKHRISSESDVDFDVDFDVDVAVDDEEEDVDDDDDADEDDDDDVVDGDYSDEEEEDATPSDGSYSSISIPPAPSAKFSRQSISLVPGIGVTDVYDFTAQSPPIASASSASIRYETGSSVDSLSSDDDDVIVVDDSDSGGGCSEVHRVDSSFWSSSSCPTGLYLVAHTKDSAHVIEDCKQGQVYVFQQLTTIQHLQLVRKTLGPYLRSTLSSHVPVHLYRNSRDHSNSFCVVLNTVESVSPVIDSLDFVAMHEILSNVDPKTVHGRKRQEDQTRVSYGFATNTSQKRDESGSAVPNLLRGTMSDFTRQLFVIMSSIFFLSFLPSWAKYRGDPKRQVYAKIIAPDNEIEGLTLHKSSPSNLCNGHMDSNNPDYVEGSVDSQLSLVVGASKWVEGERVGLTGYFRKSLTSSMERKIKNAPMLEELHGIYSQLPSDRKHMDPSTFEVFKKEGNYLDKQHVSVPCNVDPLGYHTIFLNATCVLMHVFHLSFPMIVSALICMDIFPHTGYFYDLAVYELVNGKILFDGDPWLIGRFLSLRMLQLRDTFYADKRKKREKLSIFRFNSYRMNPSKESLPTESEWIDRVQRKVGVCLFIWARAPTKPKLASIVGDYDSSSQLYQETVNGMGPLSAKHQFAILSYLGCLPDWIREYAPIEGRVLAFFQQRYPKLSWSKEPGRLTMTTIQYYMQHRIGEWWSHSKVENVICKVFRILSPARSDRNFVDVHRIDQILVVQENSSLSIAFHDGKMVPLDSNYLFGKWEVVGDDFLSTSDIASHLFSRSTLVASNKFPNLDGLMSDQNLTDRIRNTFPSIQSQSSLSFSF